MNELISFNNVTKVFFTTTNELTVIKNLSFEIHPYEIVSLLGPSGCGKSTILNLVSGLENPTSGEIKKTAKIGYMFQKDNLLSWRNIISNVCLGLEISHNKTPETINYARSLLKKYNLGSFENSYPNRLSGGMRQRVSLIRTLATSPDVLLLDEPFSALDFQTKLMVQNDVYSILKNEGKSALIVTHDISEAIALSDKIIILTNAPCKIKKIIDINFSKELTPLKRRKDLKFNEYYTEISNLLNI